MGGGGNSSKLLSTMFDFLLQRKQERIANTCQKFYCVYFCPMKALCSVVRE